MTTLAAYRVPPMHEWKAAAELRDHGIRAYVPRNPDASRREPIARGYVFAAHKPAFAKHVRGKVGNVAPAELARLYLRRQRVVSKNPFAIGQDALNGDVPGVVAGTSGDM